MPAATWHLLRRIGGYLHADDFRINENDYSRGYDPEKDRKSFEISIGDFVSLQPSSGPPIQARIVKQETGTLGGEYAGVIIGFPGNSAGELELDGFYIGAKVFFSAKNIFHLEQRSNEG